MHDGPDRNTYSSRWFATFLDTIPVEQTEREVAFIAAHLPLPGYARVLDLCCGPGRHALPLARRGHAVTGWDVDPAAIAAARFAAAAEGLERAAFEVRDIRTLTAGDGPFDAITSLWASFGLFDGDGNFDLLRRAASALRPGGRLVLDVYDATFFPGRDGEQLHARGGMAVRERKRLEGDRLYVELHYVDGHVDHFDWQVFSAEGLTALCAGAGLERVLACADFEEHDVPCGEVPRMQLVLQRDSHA